MSEALTGREAGVGLTSALAGDDGAPDGRARRGPEGPVVVLTYAHAGAERVRDLLSAAPRLTCTSGTGVLPLCHMALATWQAVEGREGASALAVKSVRALAATIIATIKVSSGGSRWCETTFASPDVGEMFLQVCPSAAFVCMHRGLPSLLTEGLRAYPWGLGGSPFWPYAGPHPGNSVAIIAAYWAACTEPLLDFEERNRERSLRVMYEDFAGETDHAGAAVYEFLGLDPSVPSALRAPQGAPDEGPGEAEYARQLNRLPPSLREKIGELTARLGHPMQHGMTGSMAEHARS